MIKPDASGPSSTSLGYRRGVPAIDEQLTKLYSIRQVACLGATRLVQGPRTQHPERVEGCGPGKESSQTRIHRLAQDASLGVVKRLCTGPGGTSIAIERKEEICYTNSSCHLQEAVEAKSKDEEDHFQLKTAGIGSVNTFG